MKIAVAQFAASTDKDANLETITAHVEDAARQGGGQRARNELNERAHATPKGATRTRRENRNGRSVPI